jgi:hypothetical protein
MNPGESLIDGVPDKAAERPVRPGAVRTELGASWWALGLVIVAVYATYFSVMIDRHTAIPFFDQTNYVGKVLDISDAWRRSGSVWEYFDPRLYLLAGNQDRPPLLMIIPALVWGERATPHEVAWMWLGFRLAALVLGVGLLARRLQTARFVPAALAVVLGSAFMLQVYPNLYQMDHAFICFALLAFVLIWGAIEEPTLWWAVSASAGALALLLIKPQGLILLLPMFIVLFGRAIVRLTGILRNESRDWGRFLAPVAVYAGLAVVVALLASSPYGLAVRAQYRLGQRGYWWSPIPWDVRLQGLAVIVPFWVLGLLAIAWTWRKQARVSAWALGLTAATLAWWIVFTMWLTYAFDTRIIAGASAIMAAMILALACQTRAFATTATTVAVALFGLNLGVATGTMRRPGFAQTALLATGPIALPQQSFKEVGLEPLVDRIVFEIHSIEGTRERQVETLIMDEFVEYSALELTRRMRHAEGVHFRAVPWGTEQFELAPLLEDRWFLTKRPRNAVELQGDALGTLQALDRLVTAKDSPLYPLMEKRLTGTTRRLTRPYASVLDPPVNHELIDEEVTLWHMRRPATATELAAALRFVEPAFQGTPGHALVVQQIAKWERE